MINQGFYSATPTKLDLNGPYMSFTTIPSGISGNPGDTVNLVGVATAGFIGAGATTVNDGIVLYRWYEVIGGSPVPLSDGNRLSGTNTNTLTISNLQSPGDSNRQFYLEAKYQSTAYENRSSGKNGNHITPAKSNPALAEVTVPPVTASITASSTSISYNGSVTISWTTSNADTVTSNFGSIPKNGFRTFINQTSSRTFRITAKNSVGSVTRSVSVNVANPVIPSISLSASPSSIENGGSTTLTWSSSNAASVVSSNFGATEVSGTTTLTNQTQSKTFSITVRSADGVERTASAPLTVAAAPQPDPPTLTLSASPSSIENGGSTTLTWSTTNATSLSSNFNDTRLSGTKTLTGLVETQTFTATAFGSGGNSGPKSATVTVAAAVPEIVITSQPSPVSATFNRCTGGGGSVNFSVGASVNNPTTETLKYQWYLNGSALSNNADLVSGAQSSELTLKVLENQSGNNTVYARVSYEGASPVPSNQVSYSVSVTEPRPSLSITSQPTSKTVFVGETATFSVGASISDGRPVSYQWYLNNNPISGATSSFYSITPVQASVGSNSGTYYVIVSDPSTTCTSVPSSIQSTSVTLTVNAPQKIIRVASRGDESTSIGGYQDINLSATTFGSGGNWEVYSPFEDIQVDMKIEAGAGSNKGSFSGGRGGQAIVRFTLRRNTEYIIRSLSGSSNGGGGATFIYEKARLIACVGGGGGAGLAAGGGAGGGVGSPGVSGTGSGGGRGGSRGAASLGYFPGGDNYCSSAASSSIFGGLVSSCTIGDRDCTSPGFWRTGYSPCSDYGFRTALNIDGRNVSGTASITRGFKGGIGHRNNGGFAQTSDDGAGGSGCEGGSAAASGSRAGGGGGNGYNGGVSVISNRTGGRSGSTRGQFTIALPGQLSL